MTFLSFVARHRWPGPALVAVGLVATGGAAFLFGNAYRFVSVLPYGVWYAFAFVGLSGGIAAVWTGLGYRKVHGILDNVDPLAFPPGTVPSGETRRVTRLAAYGNLVSGMLLILFGTVVSLEEGVSLPGVVCLVGAAGLIMFGAWLFGRTRAVHPVA